MKKQSDFQHKDAPIVEYPKAHLIKLDEVKSTEKTDHDRLEETHKALFKAGRGNRKIATTFEYKDSKGVELLLKHRDSRLVIQYHEVWGSRGDLRPWCHLTGFGLYYRKKDGSWTVKNPLTSELDSFYILNDNK